MAERLDPSLLRGPRCMIFGAFCTAMLLLTGCDKIQIPQIGNEPAAPTVPAGGPGTTPNTPTPSAPATPASEAPKATPKEIVAAFLEKARQTGGVGDKDLIEVTQLTEGLDVVTELRLTGAQVTNAGVATLSKFPKLSKVDLTSTLVNDDGLGVIRDMPELRSLDLSKTTVGDKGLDVVGDRVELQELVMTQTPITDDGLKQLSKLHQLEVLDLSETKFSGLGLEHLRSNKKLRVFRAHHSTLNPEAMKFLMGCPIEELNLDAAGINDVGMQFIGKMTKLKKLNLAFCFVTNNGVAKMGYMKDLEAISVRNNPGISNLLFEKIKKCKKLKTVDIVGSGITVADAELLEKMIPGLSVTR